VTHRITNHVTLLDRIDHWRNPQESVCLVTFNYDTLIEDALHDLGIKLQDFPDYVSNDKFKLIKLHGSINWGREINTPIEGFEEMGTWQLPQAIVELAPKLDISDKYSFVKQYPMRISANGVPLFPALAIPIEAKNDFECPTEHVDTLRELIPKVDKLLFIGWRGAEQPFLELLAANIAQPVNCLVVAGSVEDAQTTIDNARRANIPGNFFNVEGGFSNFIRKHEVDEFLQPNWPQSG
jgi:hypothetical protein